MGIGAEVISLLAGNGIERECRGKDGWNCEMGRLWGCMKAYGIKNFLQSVTMTLLKISSSGELGVL